MRIATWNVNSIRARQDRVSALLERENLDVLAIQETKCRPEQFPSEPFT
ncbi:endonuclease/exonuclease/phosphatase family protein, partial [Varibaculum cambriense]